MVVPIIMSLSAPSAGKCSRATLLDEEGQIIDRLVVVDEQYLLGRHLEAAFVRIQPMSGASGKEILFAASEFRKDEIGVGDDLFAGGGFDFDIGEQATHPRARLLCVSKSALEPRDAQLQPHPIVIDQ